MKVRLLIGAILAFFPSVEESLGKMYHPTVQRPSPTLNFVSDTFYGNIVSSTNYDGK